MKTKHSLRFYLWSFIFCLALSPMPCALSQIPQGFNYQAIARDGAGAVLQNTPLQVMFYVQSLQTGGTLFWKELHSTVTTNSFGLFTLVVGTGTRQPESTVATFNLIDWSITPKYLKTEIYYSGSWKDMGTSQLMSVPYAMTSGDLTGTVDKLSIKGTTSGLEEALFEVKNKDGQTVFAVYNEGVRIYVSDGAKALKGGFAVGGFGTDKAESTKYFFVGKDSVRVYLDTNPLTKKIKGGFAVGGYDMTKGILMQDYLDVNSDSVRIYIDSNPATKKLKGGFAVGGYDMTKGININYMNVNTDASGIISPSQNRILWYPLKNAFLTGRILITSPTNVGENSFVTGFESRAKGMYSQAMGYKVIADGDNSTAIGKDASATKTNSFAFGDSPLADGLDSYALGAGAIASGSGSYAIGSAGRDIYQNLTGKMTTASGDYSFAVGQGAIASNNISFALGFNTIASGPASTALGFGAKATGTYSTAIGIWSQATGWSSTAIGDSTIASAYNSTAIGSNTSAPSIFETAIGVWNTAYTPISPDGWNGNDRIFVIGNGKLYDSRSNAMTILKNGCVGLQSVTAPTYALQLPNNASIAAGSGRAYAWTTYSDNRLKENQETIDYGLAEVMQLLPKKYMHHSTIDQASWSSDPVTLSIGLVAQEVYPVIPEAVQVPEDESREMWGLNYDKLIPVMIKAIQDQQRQIESYKTENNDLKSQLQILQEEVEQIKSMLEKGDTR